MSDPDQFSPKKYYSRRGPGATMPDHATITEDIAQSKTVEFLEFMHSHGCVAFVTVLGEEPRKNESEKPGFGVMNINFQFGAANIEDSVEGAMMIGQVLATLTHKLSIGDPTLAGMINDVHKAVHEALEMMQYPSVGPRGSNDEDEIIAFMIDKDGKVTKV